MRLSGPMPGKNANKVGEELTPKRGRLPWRTQSPSVFRFRSMKGWPAATFAMPRTGWSFQEPRNSTGRLIPVSQSSVLSKLPGKVRNTVSESVGSGVDGSSTRKLTESWPVVVASVAWSELDQLNDPNLIGVWNCRAVVRLLPLCATVSSSPVGSTTSRLSSRVPEVVLFVKLSPGDQVMSPPTAIGTGESVTAGRSCCTLPSERLCRRLPPRVNVPQPYRLLKLSELVICWVFCSGSIAFCRITRVLLA